MTPKEEAIRALLLGVLVDGKGRFSEAKKKYDAFQAVLDIALIAMGVRRAGIVVFHKSSSLMAMIDSSDETLASVGVGFVRLTDDGEFINGSAVPCYVFTEAKTRSKNQPSLRQLALDHKACLGATADWSAAQRLPCDRATKERGHPWDTAGIAFGYIHPSPHAGLDGGLDFVVDGCLHNQKITEIMGPQSVALSDPALLPFAVKRCASANKALRRLIGDVFPDIKVRCVVWSH